MAMTWVSLPERVGQLAAAVLSVGLLPASAAAHAEPGLIEPRFESAPASLVDYLLRPQGDLDEFVRDGSTLIESWAYDLNRDGTPEYFVRARGSICGAQNCPMWVVAQDASGYSLLLNARIVQQIFAVPVTGLRYADVITRQHGSAFQSTEMLYRFDRGGYRIGRCTDESYEYLDRNGEYRVPTTPTRLPCRRRR